MTDNKRSISKPRKYNPKPGRYCVGQFLTQFYAQMQKVLKEQVAPDGEKAAAAWAMNMTMLEVTEHWCRDPWCKDAAARIKGYLEQKYQKKEEDEEVSQD